MFFIDDVHHQPIVGLTEIDVIKICEFTRRLPMEELTLVKRLKKLEAYSEPCQTPKMHLFAKIVNGFQTLKSDSHFPKKIFNLL